MQLQSWQSRKLNWIFKQVDARRIAYTMTPEKKYVFFFVSGEHREKSFFPFLLELNQHFDL